MNAVDNLEKNAQKLIVKALTLTQVERNECPMFGGMGVSPVHDIFRYVLILRYYYNNDYRKILDMGI